MLPATVGCDGGAAPLCTGAHPPLPSALPLGQPLAVEPTAMFTHPPFTGVCAGEHVAGSGAQPPVPSAILLGHLGASAPAGMFTHPPRSQGKARMRARH